MWKNSLAEISKRATKKQVLAQLRAPSKNVNVDKRVAQSAISQNVVPVIFSSASNELSASQDDFRAHLRSSKLHSSLENREPARLFVDDNDALLRQAEKLPFLYAQEAFCALVKAGELQLALQLVTFWQPLKPTNLISSRRKVKKALKHAVDTLENLKDFASLKAFVKILGDALKEQAFASKQSVESPALTHFENDFFTNQYKLFAPLGIEATSDVLTYAVAAACRFDKEDGVSALEKILLADQCASCSYAESVPGGTPRLPFALYRQMEALIAQEQLNNNFLQQVCPELSNKFVHPSHYQSVDILSLSVDEARFIEQYWKAGETLSRFPQKSEKVSQIWHRLLRRVMKQSPSLQRVEERRLLLALIAHPKQSKRIADHPSRPILRAHLIQLLKSPQQSVRRFTAEVLLKKKHATKALRIPPNEVATIYAQSFFSKQSVDPALSKFCDFAIRRLCRAERYCDAARLAWNHLSVDCPVTHTLFRTRPLAVDSTVLAMSRAMRENAQAGNAQRWMGHRSLALLRLAAAAGDNVTVLHVVPVCVNAIDCCGISFGTAHEFLSEIYKSDEKQKKWALNLVRLCSESETTAVSAFPPHRAMAAEFRRFLVEVCGLKRSAPRNTMILSPSRSKQLALWETISSADSNPRLNSLMLATFLNKSVREEILNCTFLLPKTSTGVAGEIEKFPIPTANDVWNWEVAASLAANCTSPESYQAFLRSLKQRKPTPLRQYTSDLDSISALLLSEFESYHSHDAKAAKVSK